MQRGFSPLFFVNLGKDWTNPHFHMVIQDESPVVHTRWKFQGIEGVLIKPSQTKLYQPGNLTKSQKNLHQNMFQKERSSAVFLLVPDIKIRIHSNTFLDT